MSQIIKDYEQRKFANRYKLPEFRSGDTVRVLYKIQDGQRELSDKDKTDKKKVAAAAAEAQKFRIQPFEGVVTRYRKGTADGSFTVRKIGAGGIGVERVFPLYSPFIDSIEVLASGMVRRSRLYYLRDLSGKAARIRSKFGGRLPGETAESAASPTVDEAAVQEQAPQ
jgi:large subunit ribosomal protein L19